MNVTLVVAAARNGIIGRGGDMPWRMPSSLKHFRRLTMGKPMLMGRKTFQSIGKALDGRDTIVVTRQPGFSAPGVHRVASLDEGLVLAQRLARGRGVDEIVIAGGGEIYAQALAYATRVEIDEIDAEPEGDTSFPRLDPAEWRETRREAVAANPKDEFPLVAVSYRRVGPAKPLAAA